MRRRLRTPFALAFAPAILDRTRRARPRFRLTASNADAILDICRRLDGHVRGRHLRAREWTRRFLALAPADAEPTVRARALIAAAIASLMLGDIETFVAEHDEAETLAAEGDPEVRTLIAVSLGVAHLTAEALEPARGWLEEAVRRSRALDGSWELGMALAFRSSGRGPLPLRRITAHLRGGGQRAGDRSGPPRPGGHRGGRGAA